MRHPDDEVLQQWADHELDEGAEAVARHVEGCARCAGVVAAVRQMGGALRLGVEEIALPSGSLADAVISAAGSSEVADSKAGLRALPSAGSAPAVVGRGRVVPLRAWVWSAAAAAAALMLLVSRGRTPRPVDYVVKPPSVVEAPAVMLGAEVVRVDVEGAKSYAVMEVPGTAPGATTTVVWIQDEPEDSEGSSL